MMEPADYGSIAGIALALQGLGEAIKLAASKLAKRNEEDAKKKAAEDVAEIRLEMVKIAARVDAAAADVASCLARHDKTETRMDSRDEQVRQGLDNATRTLHELALQIARAQG